MDEVIEKLSATLDEKKGRVYHALAHLEMVEKIEKPYLKWEITERGKLFFDAEYFQVLTLLVKGQLQEMDDALLKGLGVQRFSTLKVCRSCGNSQPMTKFGATDKTEDGLTRWCLPCLRLHNEKQHYGR